MKKGISFSAKDDSTPDKIGSSRKDFYIALVALIVSVTSAGISWTVYLHQQTIEESDLQIGVPQGSDDSIRIPLVNGYYARYPALIVSYRGWLNGKEIILTETPYIETNETQYPKNFRFVERDKPIYINLIFAEPPYFNVSVNDPLNTIKLVTPKINLKEEKNDLLMEIHYHDFSKKATWTINPKFEITVLNGKIIYVDLIDINRSKIKQIN